MAEIRSKRLALVNLTTVVGQSDVLYTCPADTVTLIYSCTFFNRSAATANDMRLGVLLGGAGGNIYFTTFTGVGTLTAAIFTGRIILEEGDVLRARAGTAVNCDYGIFGQELVELA